MSWIRGISQKPDQNILETTYLENKIDISFAEKELIYNLFRVLYFLQSYKDKMEKLIINKDSYCTISFPLAYLQMDKKNKRHTKKVSQILKKLVKLDPIIENFSDIHFRALVLFPNIKVVQKGRISIVHMTLVEELFFL